MNALLKMLPRALLARLGSRWLFGALIGLFVLDLFLPDPIPLVDELLLLVLMLLSGSLQGEDPQSPVDEPYAKPPEKNVTPPRA